MDDIKIMSSAKFDLEDLIRFVDFSHPFTLRDVFKMINNSAMPTSIVESIVHCQYIYDLWKEIESKPFSDSGSIEYLEVYWWGTRRVHKGIVENNQTWGFHGVGYLDHYDSDMLDMYKNMGKELPKNFRQAYAVEFSPMYELADYEIRMSPQLHMTDYEAKPDDDSDIDVDFTPSITLIDLFHAIFWELSFMGSIEERESKKEELKKSVEEIDKAYKEGRIDEVTVPFEEVKARLEEKFGKEE